MDSSPYGFPAMLQHRPIDINRQGYTTANNALHLPQHSDQPGARTEAIAIRPCDLQIPYSQPVAISMPRMEERHVRCKYCEDCAGVRWHLTAQARLVSLQFFALLPTAHP